MKFLKDNKGQIRIIEAFFASLLILASIALIPSSPPTEDTTNKTLGLKAQQLLTTLDRENLLPKLIEDRNWTALKKCVEYSLSPAIWFNLTVYDEDMHTLNDILICNGSPVSETIAAIEYLCASTGRNYRIYTIRLQLSSVT